MRQWSRPRTALFVLGLILLTTSLAAWTLRTQAAAPDPTAAAAIARAWALAEQSGRYQYRSLVDQTTYPVPSLQNAGRPPQATSFGLQGEVDRVAETMAMTFWRDKSFDPQRGVSLRVAEGQTYARAGQGEWEEAPDVATTFAPGGDPLGFLAGASNIQSAGEETHRLGEDGPTLRYTRYTFTVDGRAFGEYVRTQLEAQQQAQGELPPGITLETPRIYRSMTGSGQLWLTTDGLPARLSVQLELTDPSSGDTTKAEVTNDYWGYDRERLGLGAQGFFHNPAAWLAWQTEELTQARALWLRLGVQLVVVLAGAALGVITLYTWGSKRLYAAFVLAVAVALVVGPLLQSERVYAYGAQQQTKAAEQAAQQAEQEEAAAAQAATRVEMQPAWNPHQNPLEPAPTLPAINSIDQARQLYRTHEAAAPLTSGTDTDGDGLSDADEEYWNACPSASSTSDYCDGVSNPADTDGDGLNDGVEVNSLHTLPSQEDTDGDTIPDALEVEGFTLNGTTWYLNPNETDSNYDGRLDTYECPVWNAPSADYNPAATCPDTDLDGTPDLFDDDNDNDGVRDDADLSPEYTSGLYTYEDPFEVTVGNLETALPVILDVQFRPTEAQNLTMQNLVLDWPSADTVGHIQRTQDTTFATTSPDAQTSDSLAANGDVRITPILEISMPYSAGHYSNLPVKSAYGNLTRTPAMALDDWLDSTELDNLGITIQEADETSGDLLAYVPLTTDTSVLGDVPVAYRARMYYQPSQAGWGEAQQFRILWLVQILQEGDDCYVYSGTECTQYEETVEVVNVYHEEVTLTGLSVSEEHGTDVALLYEDPTLDDNPNLEDHLWTTSWNLSYTFMEALDCDTLVNDLCQSDGQRDVTLANMATTVDEWSTGVSYVSTSEVFSYPHQYYIYAAAVTETLNILNSEFSTSATPTLLRASEQSARTININDDGSTTAGLITLDLDPAIYAEVLSVGLSWTPYRYDSSAGAWETYDIDEYLELLDTNIQQDDFFQVAEASADATEEAEGKRLWAQYYYSVLFQGLIGLAERDGVVLWVSSANNSFPDTTYEGSQLDVNYQGFSLLANTFVKNLVETIKDRVNGRFSFSFSFWNGLKSAGSRYSFSWKMTFGVGLMLGLFTLSVIGITLYGIGYFTGNKTVYEVGRAIITAATVLTMSVWLTTLIIRIAGVIHQGMSLAIMFSQANMAVQAFKTFPVASLVVAVVIAVAFFLIGLSMVDFKNNPVQAVALLAYTLASIMVAVILFAITQIPVVGPIFFAIFAIVEAILIYFFDFSITSWLTEQIADSLLSDAKTYLRLDDGDRLDISPADSALVDEDLGFVESNSLYYSLNITNTLRARTINSDGPSSRFLNPRDAIKQSVFKYHLQSTPLNQHVGLDIGTMGGSWDMLSYKKGRIKKSASAIIPFEDVGTGINHDFSGAMYLTEAYAAPYAICAETGYNPTFLGFDICVWYGYNGSNHINIGQYVKYDILPDTITEFFYINRWNQDGSLPFPVQTDQDGDGLVNSAQGGADPDDTAYDADSDGLSDAYELEAGMSASSADSDGDGASDAEELLWYTDPFEADSDSDGLSDYTEKVEGWIYAYQDNAGAYVRTRVWSNPLSADEDEDTLSDLEEFVFGTHPQVETDPSFIKDIIRFSNLSVNESSDLQLLARFEESQGATVFADESGQDHNLGCTLATCPTAEADGRYGNALSFSGSQYITTALDLAPTHFTAAAWIYPTSTDTAYHGIMGYDTGNAITRAPSLYITEQNKLHGGFGNGTTWNAFTTGAVLTTNAWNHIAMTYDQATLRVYVNSSEVYSTTGFAGKVPSPITQYNLGRVDNYFQGRLDEAAFFDSALSAAQVADLMYGRYNPNDLVVQPGASLTYQATITNTHGTQESDGLLVGSSTYVDPVLPTPGLVLRFEADDYLMSFENGMGESTTATCLLGSTCPTTQAPGKYNYGVAFDGVDDVIAMPSLGDAQEDHTLAFWLKVDSLPANGERAYILDTERSGSGDLDIYLNSSGNIVFELEGAATTLTSNFSFNNTLNTWQHVLWTFATDSVACGTAIYMNGASTLDRAASCTTWPTLLVGPGTIGNSADGSSPLHATLDGLVFYTGQVLPYNTAYSDYHPTLEVYNGNYVLGLGSPRGDYIPEFLLQFEDTAPPYNTTIFTNPSGTEPQCASTATCPTLTNSSYTGYAVNFDGTTDYLPFTDSSNQESQEVSFYIKLDTLPASGNTATILSTNATGNQLLLTVNSGGNLVATRGTTSHTSITPLSTGVWNKVRLTYYETYNSSNAWHYTSEFYINDTFDSSRIYYSGSNNQSYPTQVGPGRLGSAINGTNLLDGSLDEFTINGILSLNFDVENFAEVALLNELTEGRTAFCEDVFACPNLTSSGRFGSALSFDGTNDYLTMDPPLTVGVDNFTTALWFKTSTSNRVQYLLQQADGTGNGRAWLNVNASNKLESFLGNITLAGTTTVTDGQWHHAATTYDGTTLKLYLDGTLEASAPRTLEASDGNLLLGIWKNLASGPLSGSMDEVVILPEAVDAAAVQMLMGTTWPAISLDDDFVTFNVPALNSTTATGAFQVSSNAQSSRHRFDEEVEVALQLSQDITIPVVDTQAANLVVFLPFEDVPGSTTVENVVSAHEFTCSGDHCPTAGLRGIVDRAASFDGEDDYIVNSDNSLEVISVAAWVKADRGTILDSTNTSANEYSGTQLDFNRFRLVFGETGTFQTYELPIELPENEWVHVVGVYDDAADTASVYVNGTLQISETVAPNNAPEDDNLIRVGLNDQGTDPLHGFLDDLRVYNVALSASDVTALYSSSAPTLRFEFDEDGSATTFADSSPTEASGQPLIESCVPFALNSLTVNSLASATDRDLYVSFDGTPIVQQTNIAASDAFAPGWRRTVCGGEAVEVGLIESDGSATTLGTLTISATDVSSVANTGTSQSYSPTFAVAGDSITLQGELETEVVTQPNPAPGTDGQIGNTALFDGAGYIEVQGADAVDDLTNSVTIMAWINPDDTSGTQRILSSGRDASDNGFSFGFTDGTLIFSKFGIATHNSTAAVTANAWQHVVVTFDSNQDAKFYVDGALQNTSAGSTNILPNSDDPLYIGVNVGTDGGLTDFFKGQIDELAVYGRELSAAEINSIYMRELRWYRAKSYDFLTIDTDTPTFELLTDYAYRADGYIQLGVVATDTRSDVRLVDFGLHPPSASNFTWEDATTCQSEWSTIHSAAWCPAFTSSGEGAYTFKFRAVDTVGNEATSDTYTLYVDATPPQASSSYVDQWVDPVADPTEALKWTIPLSGSISDPTLPGGIAGSGVYTVNFSVTLTDSTGETLGDPNQLATVSGTTWSIDYEVNGPRPSGLYTIGVTAEDLVGNDTSTTVGTIYVDGRAPETDLNTWELPTVISTSLTLAGATVEQPIWGGQVGSFHFEQTGSSLRTSFNQASPTNTTIFHDSGAYGMALTCTAPTCPTTVSGLFGQALDFDGVDDILTLDSADVEHLEIDSALTLATWVNPDTINPSAIARFITLGSEKAVLRLDTSNRLDFYLTLDGTIRHLRAANVLTAGSYQHIAATYDGETMRLYHDGLEVGTLAISGTLAATTSFSLGSSVEPFDGKMDEAQVFDRALSAKEVYALAQHEVAGVTDTEIAIQALDPTTDTLATDDLDWQPATITGSGARLDEWQYTLPAGLEDLHIIYGRSQDESNNLSMGTTLWSGLIDTLAPRVAVTMTHWGSGDTATTNYQFTVDDFGIVASQLTHPCGADDIAWDYYQETDIPQRASGGCRVPGHASAPITVSACDIAGHCTTETSGAVTTLTDVSAILTPTVGSTVMGLDPIAISGLVLSPDGVQTLVVTIDGQPVYTETWPSGTTQATWSTSWTPTTEGSYALEATLTTGANNTVTDPFSHQITARAPMLSLAKSVAPPTGLSIGAGLTYTIVVSNTGSITATNVRLTDTLPLGLSGSDLDEIFTLAPSEAMTWTLPATVTAEAPPTITNTAVVSHTWQRASASATATTCHLQVTNANDSGPGSLRQAISDVCEGGAITFAADFAIYLDSTLSIARHLTITGSGHTITISGDSGNDGSRNVRPFTIAAAGNVTITNLSVVSGTATFGGGLFNAGTLLLEDVSVVGNHVTNYGGGIINESGGTLTMRESTLANNTADNQGAGLNNDGTVTLDMVLVADNVAPNNGGGLLNGNGRLMTIRKSTISGNSAQSGGGIYNDGTLTLESSEVVANEATFGGGLTNTTNHTATISDSTFANNRASGSAGVSNQSAATITISNSTFSGNIATDSTSGGGGLNLFGTTRLTNVTIAQNQGYLGAGLLLRIGTHHLTNVLVAENTSLAAVGSVQYGQCASLSGTIATNLNTLIEENHPALPCGNPTLTTGTALSPLGDYGGETQIHALLPGSTAIDTGNAAACPATDQRGVDRQIAGACDIGAFESRQNFTLAATSGNNQSTPVNLTFPLSLTVVLTDTTYGEPTGPGALVTFSGPTSGPGISPQVVTASTNASGVAAASVTANSIWGTHIVTASAPGVSNTAAFTLTNQDAQPDLALSKTVNTAVAAPGETITYTLAFTNISNGDALGVVLTDVLPSGVIPLGYTASGVTLTPIAGASYRWHVSDMTPGGNGRVVITARIADSAANTVIVNMATIANNVPERSTNNNSASASVSTSDEMPDLVISTAVAEAITARGETVTYTLAFSNVGNYPASGVVLTDVLPADFTMQSMIASGVNITQTSSSPLVWSLGNLDPDAGGTLTLVALVGSNATMGSPLTNTATIAGSLPESNSANNSASAAVTVAYPCRASVTTGNDSGAGSLRQVVADLCAGGTIFFAEDTTVRLASVVDLTKTLTIDGGGQAITISGDTDGDGIGNTSIFAVKSTGVVTLSQLSIVSGTNSAITNFAGNLTVISSTLAGNQSTTGGAINATGRTIVRASTFRDNRTTSGGGGAIRIAGSGATLEVDSSTFASNSAASSGGAIIGSLSMLTTTNSTFVSNTSTTAGSALSQVGGGMALNHNTFWANTSPAATLSTIRMAATTLSLTNNIVGGTTSTQQCNLGTGTTIIVNHNNLITDGSCSATITADPLLTPLGDYGGDTQTMVPQSGSPAIDAGNASTCLATDQRGQARPVGAACDIGAVESVQDRAVLILGGDNQSTLTNTPFAQPLVVQLVDRDTQIGISAGHAITFTAPSSGASLTLPLWSATTDASGVVTASLTANGVVGSYQVSIAGSGASSAASITLSNVNATSTPTATATSTPTETVTATSTPTETATATSTPTPTDTSSPTATSTPSATATGTLEASPTATHTPSPTATGTLEASPTATPSATATGTLEASPTATPSATATVTGTVESSPTATVTGTVESSPTATPSATATGTLEASPTATPSATATVTGTVESSPTATATQTTCTLNDMDLDDDGATTIIDVQLAAAQFGASGTVLVGDVDCDGMVIMLDIVTIASHWQ